MRFLNLFHLFLGFLLLYKYWYSCSFYVAFFAKIARTLGRFWILPRFARCFWYWLVLRRIKCSYFSDVWVCWVVGWRFDFVDCVVRDRIHLRRNNDFTQESSWTLVPKSPSGLSLLKIEWNKWSNSRIGLGCSRFSLLHCFAVNNIVG